MNKYLVLILAWVILLPVFVHAEVHENAGTKVGAFLKICVGARPAGMGEAFSAVADDVNAIYWNPAGLAQINHKQATFMHNSWLYDLKYEFLAYCQPNTNGVCGISLTYLRMGDLEGRDKDDNPIGNFSAYDFALNIAYAVIANENCYVGISGKLIRQKIENSIANAVGIDLGILYLDPSREGLKFAAVIQNIASKLKFIQKRESLTSACKLGMSYKMNKLTLASDITYPEDNAARINLGAEYLLTTNLALRLGYNSKNDLDSGWTFGAGFKLNTLQIDYAFVSYGELDNTHRVSLTKRF